jgi:hypothetical protein
MKRNNPLEKAIITFQYYANNDEKLFIIIPHLGVFHINGRF